MPVTSLASDHTPSPITLWRWGAALLWTGFGLGLAILLVLLWQSPALLPLFPALLIGGAVVVYLLRHPFLHLSVVLLASVLILQHEPGVQVSEVLYGLYAMFFLVTWFIGQMVVRGERIFASRESRVLLWFGLLVVALIPASFLFGATPHTVVRELTSLVMLGFFFPIREACARRSNGVRVLVGIALVLSLFVVVRNLFMYQAILGNAERLGEMVGGRVIANDHVLTASALVAFVFLLHANKLRHAVGYIVVFMFCFGGLLLTLSRGFWLAFGWGLLLMFAVVERQYKVRLLLYGSLATLPLLGIGLVFFGNLVMLFLEGLLERLTSVRGSLTQDVSMLGRIYEGRAALGHIAANPILGHGVGVPFTFSTILTRTEITTTFIHNGYIYLWYAFGLPGAGLMLYLWWRAIGEGVRSFRVWNAPLLLRLTGLGAAVSLFAFTLSAMTSNPFFHKDYLLGLAYLMGLAYGVRARLEAPASVSA